MRTSTLIGVGIGGAALFALWHMWGKKAVAVARGNSATVIAQSKAIKSSYIGAANAISQARTPGAFTQSVQSAAPEVRGKYTNDQIRAKLAMAGGMS